MPHRIYTPVITPCDVSMSHIREEYKRRKGNNGRKDQHHEEFILLNMEPENTTQVKSQKTAGYLLTAASLIFLVLAVYLRRKGSDFFYILYSSRFSPVNLAYDQPFPNQVLMNYFGDYFKIFLSSYILPILAGLVPSIILMGLGFEKIMGTKKPTGEIFPEGKGERLFLTLVFLISTGLLLIVHFKVMVGINLFIDEFAYLFQSKIIATGRLYAASPPLSRFFSCAHIINDGRWYSKFSPGWPALLSPGVFLGIPFIISPMLTAGTLVLFYKSAKKLFNPLAGILAVFMAAFSAQVFMTGATCFSHPGSGFFILLLIYSLVSLHREKKMFYSVLGGIAVLFLFQIRPSDGAVILTGFIPWLIYTALEFEDRKKGILMILPVLLGGLLGGVLLILANQIQNGNPFLLGFIKYRPHEKMGFGSYGHTPLRGLYNFAYSTMRMAFWTVPLMLLGTLSALCFKKKETILLLIPPACFLLFYFFYYSLGNEEFGARYYHPVLMFLILPGAGGWALLKDKASGIKLLPSGGIVPAYMIATGLFLIFGVYTAILPYVHGEYARFKNSVLVIKNPPFIQEKSIIFCLTVPGSNDNYLTTNDWDYKDQKILRVLSLMPEENRELMEALKERKPYLLDYDYNANRFQIIPYPAGDMEKASNYLYAAENYRFSVLDNKKAEECYKRAIEMDPQNPRYQFALGRFYFDTNNYRAALDIFSSLIKQPSGFADEYYFLGRCHGELGQTDDAINTLEHFIKAYPQSPLASKARQWVIYYKKIHR